MPEFEAVSWYALMAPIGTPQTIVAKLHDGAVEAINAPEATAALEAQGAKPVGNTPTELAAVIAADTARWAKVIRDAAEDRLKSPWPAKSMVAWNLARARVEEYPFSRSLEAVHRRTHQCSYS